MNVVSKISEDRSGRSPSKRGRPAPEKLAVLAADVADAVNAAGGLIFDRVSAGWRVEVYLEAPGDERPLRILGVASHFLPDNLDSEPESPDALVVAADLRERNTDVRRFVAAASRGHHVDVAIWEGDRPTGSEEGIGRVEHRLSAAAQAFKVHAMNAAGLKPLVSPTESFRNGQR